MRNCIEDITPSAYRNIVSNNLQGANILDINADSDVYEYYWIMHFRGNGVFQPRLRINGNIIQFDFRTDIRSNLTANSINGAHGQSEIALFDTNGNSAIATGRLFSKDGEGTKLVFCKQYSKTNATTDFVLEHQANWWPQPNDKITSFGWENPQSGSGDILLRVYRWPRGLPFNDGDTLFSGDITAEKVVNVDPISYQSLGYEWQGTTGYKVDLNNQETANFYHHGSVRNANTNGPPPALAASADLIESNNTHASGSLDDIPNTLRTLRTTGGSRSYNPSVEIAKYAMSSDSGTPVNVLDFKPNGTLDGRLDIQRNTIFPYMQMPLNVIFNRNFSAADLSTQVNVDIPEGYHFAVFRFMGSAASVEDLQILVNGAISGYSDGFQGHSGVTHTSNAKTARPYLASISIGNGTVGNMLMGIVPIKAINDYHCCFYHDSTQVDQSREYVCEFNNSADITTIQLQTANSSNVTGKFQVFGVM